MDRVALDIEEIRAVARFAVGHAEDILSIFERAHPDDLRPRAAIGAAQAFAFGGKRTAALCNTAFGAHRAAMASDVPAASQAARSCMCAANAAFLYPLAHSTQVKHILGATVHAARAAELDANDDPRIAEGFLERVTRYAPVQVLAVLRRYPAAPLAGGRVGELLRMLDSGLRNV